MTKHLYELIGEVKKELMDEAVRRTANSMGNRFNRIRNSQSIKMDRERGELDAKIQREYTILLNHYFFGKNLPSEDSSKGDLVMEKYF